MADSYGPQSVKVFNQDGSKLSFPLAGSREHDMLRHLRNPENWEKPILTSCLNGICKKIIATQRHYKLYNRCWNKSRGLELYICVRSLPDHSLLLYRVWASNVMCWPLLLSGDNNLLNGWVPPLSLLLDLPNSIFVSGFCIMLLEFLLLEVSGTP